MRGLVLLAILIALAALCIIIWLYIKAKTEGWGKKVPLSREWKVELQDSEAHPITSFYLVCGERREYFGSVNRVEDEYEQKLYNLQAAADDEVVERNTITRTLQGDS